MAVKDSRGFDSTLLSQTKRLLSRLDLKARKSLGQHFLVDREVLAKVAEAAGLTPDDIVIEVGPGLGVLTGGLAEKAGRVIAIELDDRLAGILKQRLASAGNVTVVNGDILKLEPLALVGDKPIEYKVVANLPYYITSAVIRHFLEASLKPRLMVVMVQKEVAEAIVAEPGRMSLLSVSVQFYGRPEIVSYAPAGCFYPAPEVDSAILRINVYSQPAVAVDDRAGFFRLVRAGFTASRKQLANSLALGLGLPKAEVMPLLETAGIMHQRRAETLALGEWQRLWQALRER
ncbi:16S rRNA (adenine(1518)-N(6)/adenine(1519)-N(6))-dimethyltransferase RsmA [Chloroflexota bacterium]